MALPHEDEKAFDASGVCPSLGVPVPPVDYLDPCVLSLLDVGDVGDTLLPQVAARLKELGCPEEVLRVVYGDYAVGIS